jgi:hypothetical protein
MFTTGMMWPSCITHLIITPFARVMSIEKTAFTLQKNYTDKEIVFIYKMDAFFL